MTIAEIQRCVTDAEKIASHLGDPELRVKAFEIVLVKLLDDVLILGHSDVKTPTTSRDDIESISDEYPSIDQSASTVNNIRRLFDTEWAKKRRTSSEITKALDANGVPDDKHVSTILNRLVTSGELKKIKRGNVFVFWKNPANDAIRNETL